MITGGNQWETIVRKVKPTIVQLSWSHLHFFPSNISTVDYQTCKQVLINFVAQKHLFIWQGLIWDQVFAT